jgi:hypothetical protein
MFLEPGDIPEISLYSRDGCETLAAGESTTSLLSSTENTNSSSVTFYMPQTANNSNAYAADKNERN